MSARRSSYNPRSIDAADAQRAALVPPSDDELVLMFRTAYERMHTSLEASVRLVAVAELLVDEARQAHAAGVAWSQTAETTARAIVLALEQRKYAR